MPSAVPISTSRPNVRCSVWPPYAAVDMAINTILDLRVTLGILIDHIIVPVKGGCGQHSPDQPEHPDLYHAASSGFRSDAVRNTQLYIGDSLASQAIHTRSTVYIPDLNQTRFLPQVRVLTGEGFVTYFGVPLMPRGRSRASSRPSSAVCWNRIQNGEISWKPGRAGCHCDRQLDVV